MQKKRTEGSVGSVSMLCRRYCVPGYGSGKLRSAPPRVLWVLGIGCIRGKGLRCGLTLHLIGSCLVPVVFGHMIGQKNQGNEGRGRSWYAEMGIWWETGTVQ